ncbi:MAG TPA: DUF1697 domain-containing protein [Planctomycetota bacterium]
MVTRRIALLRGINVGGNKKVPMVELRELAAELGWQQVETWIQSGNVVFAAAGRPAALEKDLEQAIERHFGFQVPVVVRTSEAWSDCAASKVFAAAKAERPAAVHLGFAKQRCAAGAAKALQPYCTQGERVEIDGDAVWIDFKAGVARSKVTSAVLDRVIGSTVTLRNWKTVLELAALVRAARGA